MEKKKIKHVHLLHLLHRRARKEEAREKLSNTVDKFRDSCAIDFGDNIVKERRQKKNQSKKSKW